jgi:hypothetical protein
LSEKVEENIANLANLETQNDHNNARQVDNPVDEESPVREDEMNLRKEKESEKKASLTY